MRLGFNYWIGTLIFFSSFSFSNPFFMEISSGIAESLVAAGVSRDQAVSDANSIISKKYNPYINNEATSSGSFFDFSGKKEKAPNKEVSIIQDLFSDSVKKSYELRNGSGDRGIIYDVVENGTAEDLEKLKKHYQDQKITFKHAVSPEQTYKLTDIFKQEAFKEFGFSKILNGFDATIAPEWYGQMGMSVYRTESPIIKRKGIPYYIYFDTLYSLYESGFGYGFLKFPHVNSVTVSLGKDKSGKETFFDIYREEPDIYADEKDAVLSLTHIYHNVYLHN